MTDRPTDRPSHALLTAGICCAYSLRASTCIRMPATYMATYEWVSRILAARRNALSRCNKIAKKRQHTVVSYAAIAITSVRDETRRSDAQHPPVSPFGNHRRPEMDFASKVGIFELIKSIRGISEGCRGAVMALERNCLKRKLILNRSDEQHVHPI